MSVALKLTTNKHIGLLWFNYFTYLLMFPAIIGLVVSVVNSNMREQLGLPMTDVELPNDMVESHYQWQIRTFVIGVLMSMASIGTIYYGVGYFLAVISVLYWFFRIIHGMYRLATNQPMPGAVSRD